MPKRLLLPLALLSAPLLAADMDVTVEIPRLQVAEYHRPYVAIWLEKPDQSHAADLAVWYDLKLKDKEGEKWLKDLRQWWRRSGRSLPFSWPPQQTETQSIQGESELGAIRLTLNP